ncbi:voltage-gated chloride channel family protein [Bacteroides mediterraneensis]|uniref:voltage-gated chloride channel family protein n=1 Tax=Bacteroides mediterraneensis TaxID=1841856 RepID=UPI0009325C4B|nr:voltage-gated chloride channel family protein [Bacteroides mediterraneensis]
MKEKIKNYIYRVRFEQVIFGYILKWILITAVAGALIGSASALLLSSLNWATDYRESHLWIIGLLPLAGLVIGLIYHYFAGTAARGNNFLIEEIHSAHNIIPFKMAPLVYIGTVLTHLFGGSAGREGTGVQMGGAIADFMSRVFRMHPYDRKIMIQIGIGAGFASVFGTPLAGAVFALEVIIVGRMRYDAILPIFLASFFANYACHAWGIKHTVYHITQVPELGADILLWVLLASVFFGLTARLFSRSIEFWSRTAKKYVAYAPFRPLFGGICIALCVWVMGTTKYIGLGVPVIVNSFSETQMWYDFLLKLILTTFTIGVGFKGGEVTPLFFVGATLGSALSAVIPLPLSFMAGIGFVAVFAGATNTPIACTFMGIELFGVEAGIYLGIACVASYLFSGHTGIYTAQIVGSPKHIAYWKSKKGTTID